MPKNAIKAIELQSFDAATLAVGYQAVNPNGFEKACFLVRIVNNSNNLVFISYDGATDNDAVAPNSTVQLSFLPNPQAIWPALAKGTVVWVSSGTANAGTITVSGYYQENV